MCPVAAQAPRASLWRTRRQFPTALHGTYRKRHWRQRRRSRNVPTGTNEHHWGRKPSTPRPASLLRKDRKGAKKSNTDTHTHTTKNKQDVGGPKIGPPHRSSGQGKAGRGVIRGVWPWHSHLTRRHRALRMPTARLARDGSHDGGSAGLSADGTQKTFTWTPDNPLNQNSCRSVRCCATQCPADVPRPRI